VIDLKKTDFMKSAVLKVGDIKVMRIAFAFPNLNPGDVVEYRWTERYDALLVLFHSFPIFCQEKLPVREFRFAVESYPVDFSMLWLNCAGRRAEKIGCRKSRHSAKSAALRGGRGDAART